MKKAWNPIWIAVVSFFFSMLPGLILMAFNYERLGKPNLKKPLIAFAILFFIFLCYLTTAIPKEYDWVFAVIHLGIPILIAYIQKPLYEQFLDASDDHEPESFTLPVIYSFIFLMVFFGGISGYQYYDYVKMRNGILETEHLYLEGKLEEAKAGLFVLHESYPNNSAILFNLATIYESELKKDSAKIYLRKILEFQPNDESVKEALYRLEYE
jgi:tetratricopeptide (TPR) repeat protein